MSKVCGGVGDWFRDTWGVWVGWLVKRPGGSGWSVRRRSSSPVISLYRPDVAFGLELGPSRSLDRLAAVGYLICVFKVLDLK